MWFHGEDVDTKKEELVKKEQLISATNVAKQYTFQELTTATNGFSEILGQGGSATVYKGFLDGTDVAVKMLSSNSQQGSQEFLNKVYYFGLLSSLLQLVC